MASNVDLNSKYIDNSVECVKNFGDDSSVHQRTSGNTSSSTKFEMLDKTISSTLKVTPV